MSIWYKEVKVEDLNESSHNTMTTYLDIQFIEIGENYLKARMPVNEKNVQPMRLLHGGASVVLAETLGSVASWLINSPESVNGAVGVEINANHLRSVKEGQFVEGIVTPLKLGKNIHVWEIKIFDNNEKLCCVSRLTTMILHKT